MKTTTTLILIILAMTFRGQAQLPAAYAAGLQHTLDSLCSRYKVQGASAAVFVPGYGVWEGVSGESHDGVAMTSGMALPLNSNTKTYVAVAMLKLQEQGLLSLNDTIGRWIKGKAHISGAVTIRQLLNHTSGLFSYTDTADFGDSLEADFARIWQPDEMLRFIGKPLFAPGASWSYSNTNYLLAGMIIAQVTGKPVEDALRDLVLRPQGLSATWFYPQERPSAVIPHFWFVGGSGSVDGDLFGYTPESFYSAAHAAGALFATASDNVMFWHRLNSGAILNAASMAEWRTTIRLGSSVGYGLGTFRYPSFNSRVIYEHGGTGAGAINENLADSSSGVCISLLTNQEAVDNNTLLNVIVRALHRITIAPPTRIGTAFVMPEWRLYPVPAARELHIDGTWQGSGPVRGAILDMSGRLLRETALDGSTLSLEGLADGSYWLELRAIHGSLGMRRFEVRR